MSTARVRQLDDELRPARSGPLGWREYDPDMVERVRCARVAAAAERTRRARAAGRIDSATTAARLGVSEREVDRLRCARALRGTPDGGGGWLYPAKTVDALAGALDAARRRLPIPPPEAP